MFIGYVSRAKGVGMSDIERRLQAQPEYAWLFKPSDGWYNVAETARGLGVSRTKVTEWCKEKVIPGVIYYGEDVGYRLPRSGLIEFLAQRLNGQQSAG